ncbi:c2 domain-containing protein [Ditylenchus destructor]|nr:c2 domain-containing protein [Ditylenchus destructor]
MATTPPYALDDTDLESSMADDGSTDQSGNNTDTDFGYNNSGEISMATTPPYARDDDDVESSIADDRATDQSDINTDTDFTGNAESDANDEEVSNASTQSADANVPEAANNKKVKRRRRKSYSGSEESEIAPEEFVLSIGIFKLCELADSIRNIRDPTKKTVEPIRLRIYRESATKKLLNRKQLLCTEFLPLDQISREGFEEDAFLHNFGQGFINFYGPNVSKSMSSLRKRRLRHMRDGSAPGNSFCGRVLLSINGDEADAYDKKRKPSRRTIGALMSDLFFRQRSFTLFSTFYACNLLHPDYSTKNVQFVVSAGEYGNDDYFSVPVCTNRTLSTMPGYDTLKYFAMPWGNHKPVCEVPCLWEDIGYRIEQSNAILKIVDILIKCQDESIVNLGTGSQESNVWKTIKKAVDDSLVVMKQIRAKYNYHLVKKSENNNLTELDYRTEQTRYRVFEALDGKFGRLLQQTDLDVDEIVAKIDDFIQILKGIANDVQISMPDVIVSMVAKKEVVAFARIPVSQIFYSSDENLRGSMCGRIQPIYLSWTPATYSKAKKNELPCVLHMKLWFGYTKLREVFKQSLDPAEIKYFAEVFFNQKRKLLSSDWVPSDNPPPISDESGLLETTEDSIRPPYGWKFNGNWEQKRSHDMWIGPDAGRKVQIDEFFEVQKKGRDHHNEHYSWLALTKTTFYGDKLDDRTLEYAPDGWVYEKESWRVDPHSPGDEDGWQYSKKNDFWEEDTRKLETDERDAHRYRRRRFIRTRRLIDNESQSDPEKLNRLTDGWEYSHSFSEPFHTQYQRSDKVRRRRTVREISGANTDQIECNLSPRIYEIHDQVSMFQLRVYVLWARELNIPQNEVSPSYVRIFFLNECRQTLPAESSINPIFNETVVFPRVPVPGGVNALRKNSPSMVIEVFAEGKFGSELFLGRMDYAPFIISSSTNKRAEPRWFPLCFSGNKTSGSLLVCAELFQADPAVITKLAPLPPLKKDEKDRYEIPKDIRPIFAFYAIQFLCWGVRDMPRYQLFPVRSPFVQLTVGDHRETTDIIENTKKNPNFDRPLITIENVLMPRNIYFAPPISLQLHDRRSFGRKPLVGSTVIRNFVRFIQREGQSKGHSVKEIDWESYERVMLAEDNILRKDLFNFDINSQRDLYDYTGASNVLKPTIDWWSKYYYSIGDEDGAPGYKESGLDKLVYFICALEDVDGLEHFEDFLDTFIFRKPIKNKLDDNHVVKPKKGERGQLKAKFFIHRMSKSSEVNLCEPPGIEFPGIVPCILRVYIVRAKALRSRRSTGYCDPYIMVKCGSKKIKAKKNYISDTIDPLFGQMYEMEIKIPIDRKLIVTVMDNHRLLPDREIGSTEIDLENRLLSAHRATVGLPQQFNVFGPLPWRDQLTPLQILRRHCKKMRLPVPTILESEKEGDNAIVFDGKKYRLKDIEPKIPVNEDMLGRPLQRIALHILNRMELVPEHIETRTLYREKEHQAMKCGNLEMFIDLFPRPLGTIPPPINIKPRRPKSFELRIAVWQVKNAILKKRSFGKPAADLYVKCYLNGDERSHKTDIHYRSTDGTGSFNYRLVFDVEYDIWQKMLVISKKRRMFRKKSKETVDPILVIQLWDNNKFKKDGLIGEYCVNLLGVEEGQLFEDELGNVVYAQEKDYPCCANCIRGCLYCFKCCTSSCCRKGCNKAKKLIELPRAPIYVPDKNVGRLSLFEQKSVDAWYPFLSRDLAEEQKAKGKKNDNYDRDLQYVTGAVQLAIDLLTREEAKKDPVGKGRKKPNNSPYLPKPDRPLASRWWVTSRLKAATRICWNKCGCQTLCYAVIVIVLVLSTMSRVCLLIFAAFVLSALSIEQSWANSVLPAKNSMGAQTLSECRSKCPEFPMYSNMIDFDHYPVSKMHISNQHQILCQMRLIFSCWHRCYPKLESYVSLDTLFYKVCVERLKEMTEMQDCFNRHPKRLQEEYESCLKKDDHGSVPSGYSSANRTCRLMRYTRDCLADVYPFKCGDTAATAVKVLFQLSAVIHDHRKRLENRMQSGTVLEPTPEDCKVLMSGAEYSSYSLTAVCTLVVVCTLVMVSLALAANRIF